MHNDREVGDSLKIQYSEVFQDKYIENLDGFIDFVSNSYFGVKKEYKESWDFIKKDNNSIDRFTNFNILLDDYLGG